MEELNAIKRELKCWESMFERKHGRRPNKDDIKNSSDEIRDTYVKYKHLKEANIKEKKKSDEDDDDGVFGKKLNKKFEHKQPLASVRLKGWENIKPVRLCHGQRVKPKTTSPTKTKPEVENVTYNQTKDNEIDEIGFNSVSISSAIKTPRISHTSAQKTSSLRKTPGTAESRLKRRASLFAASLKKIDHSIKDTADFSSDVMSSHDLSSSEDFGKQKETIGVLKYEEFESNDSFVCESNELRLHKEDKVLHENKEFNSTNTDTVDKGFVQSSLAGKHVDSMDVTHSISEEEMMSEEMKLNSKLSKNQEGEIPLDLVDHTTGGLSSKKPTSSPKIKVTEMKSGVETSDAMSEETRESIKMDREQENKEVNEITMTTKDTHDVCSISEHEKIQKEENQRKRKANEDVEVPDTKKVRLAKVEDDSENEDGSISDEGPDDTFEEVKVKNSSSKSRSSSSSLVSDNFVRLDMKHKAYRRRGHGMTGSAYKRRAFNNIMKARGEYVSKSSWSRRGAGGRGRGRGSFGSSKGATGTCFKCGQEGHWAKNCKGKMSTAAREIPEDDDDAREEFAPEDDDFIHELTLEKAAQMAAGIAVDEDADGSSLVVLPHQLPRPAYVPPPPPDAIEPLFETVDGKIIETPKKVYAALGQLGFSTFRTGQEEAIMRILSGVSSLVVLSTGAGKSLCYQLPAYMYYKRSPCISLVISPLVSLMEDQIGGLPFGLKGACLHTNQTKAQRDKIIDNIVSGKIAVLLLSPEALVGSGSGGGCLPSNARLPPIAFACIDEAHCLSEWSHNFRPSYLRVCKVLRERFGVRCFLGLTATATRATAASVAQHLGISNDEGAVIRGAAVPPNLYLSVSRDRDRDKALIELLQGPRFSNCESIIIYCTRREVTERVATLVRTCLQHMTPSAPLPANDDEEEEETSKKKAKKRGKKKAAKSPLTWEAESYHAGMSAAQRRRVQKRFMSGELRIVVATVAFGMGLDKSDVRAIIHYNMPKSFESYVQEIGRAGRDGLPSHCHVFLDREGKDMYELKRHIHANTVDRVVVKKLVNKLFPRCHCKKLHDSQQQRKRRQQSDQVDQMVNENEEFVSDEILSQICEEQSNTIADKGLEVEKMERMIGVTEGQGNDKMERLNSVTDDQGNDEMERMISVNEDQESDKMERMIGVTGDQENDKMERMIGVTGDQGNDKMEGRINVPNDEIEPMTISKHNSHAVNHNDSDEDVEGNSSGQSRLRICGGHDVAIAIESAVQELDMPEESIATLLCYLELHQNRWLEVLHPVKATCTVKFYGGHAHLRAVAKRIPPIAAAVVHCEKEKRFKKQSSLVFPVVEIADKMGWDLDPVYKELRALQWNSSLAPDSKMSSSGQSGILVELSDHAIHVRTPGDLSDEDRDEVCDFVNDRIQAEERTQLKQLTQLYTSLKNVSCSEYWQCSEQVDKESDQELKTLIKGYFDDMNNATQIELEALKKERVNNDATSSESARDEHVNWDGISRDIRALTNIHHDQSFTGRAVARIFHGISSPCYPAEVWGRDRRFWRKYLDVDFNSLRRYATRQLLKLR